MQTMESREALFAAMRNGATLITPNNRLSNQLLSDYFKDSSVGIKAAVSREKPRCLPYQAFLRDRFKQARHLYANMVHPILLTQQQQRYLWQQILTQDQARCNDGLLSEVQDAWARCQHWQIDSHHPAFAETPQTRQFQQWQQQLEQHLNRIGAITEQELAIHLTTYPDLFNVNTIIWVCFDDYTPQQRTLQQAMDANGCQQYHYDLAYRATTTHQYPAKDSQDEYLQMIQWIKDKLSAGKQRIAVVIPDLQTQSHSLQRLLQRHIPPNQFSISLGLSLLDYPLVAHALHWLSLSQQTMSNHQARLLLHSPYISGSKTEFGARSEIMQASKTLQEPTISLTTLVKALDRVSPTLAQLLNNLSEYPQKASANEWIGHFKTRLIQLGFPGEYSLDSLSYQCFQRFMALFDELLQLSVISPLMSKTQALNALHDLAKFTIFQPQKSTTPVQVLGLLEASGCTFDSIWMSGLTDQCLPQKTRLSAFIPLDLQRELQMPHALPLRELQFAQQVIQRLQNGSCDSVFSYPCLTGDIPNLPSPLICHFLELTTHDIPPASSTSFLVSHEELYDLPLTPDEPVSGGTTLLANQAKCPFRAFAAHRLYAKPGPAVTDGPDASERGQIMHKIMDLLWQDLRSQQNLLTLTHHELHQ